MQSHNSFEKGLILVKPPNSLASMEGEPSEFHDWEMLNNSDERSSVNSFDSVETTKSLEGIEADSEGMIRTDYFSLDSHNKYVKTVSEEGSIESDNPSWIDPESETRYPRKEPGEFWPDSGSDKSDDLKFNEFDANNELGFVENEKTQLGFEGIGEIGPVSMEFGDFEHDNNANSESAGEKGLSSGNESDAIGAMKSSGGEEEKRSVVWWKLPFEFFKYCAFKVNPVWTFSVAAAVIGVVVLGRRLFKMKKKNQSLQLKVTMDDKRGITVYLYAIWTITNITLAIGAVFYLLFVFNAWKRIILFSRTGKLHGSLGSELGRC